MWKCLCIVWYGMLWHGMLWNHSMVWYGMVWHGIGMVWYCMHCIVWYHDHDMILYGMVWYGMVWYGMVLVWHENILYTEDI